MDKFKTLKWQAGAPAWQMATLRSIVPCVPFLPLKCLVLLSFWLESSCKHKAA